MTDTYSADRASIVAFLRKQAEQADREAAPFTGDTRRWSKWHAQQIGSFADQIERCDDLKPAKAKATIADLLALHDLDLGALANKMRVTGEDFTTAHVETLCGALPIEPERLALMVWNSLCDGPGDWGNSAQVVATLGSKVRAALSTPTIKATTPRVLQSADEAPCGSLVKDRDDDITLRFTDGYGQHLGPKPRDYGAVVWTCKTMSPCIFKPITLIAEGLTEAECRHLSGLSAADALVWCEARDKACATHDAAVIDRLQRDGDSLRSLLAVIRHALGAGDHNDIVKHARAIKARADRA